ncbi:hypothetical protein NP511_03620 [Natrinema thermotolerans]|uniref:Uncharacterized protein n=1 Tax=Natrinema thermotolerans TaxID=121872 RepID=A0AAF0PCJ5_9EURY|nr:hypothetical protein [Natrinema thermotolerans]QCC57648.1 hypothetical protein DVR14_02915 [Natrinema thermotolerans]WMT08727.1 hypothetical protein NP511_03620 [Natrinema thermotolerans]
MDERSIAGLVATAVIAALAVFGLYGFTTGYLLDSPGEYLAPSMGVLAVAAVAVAALIASGVGSGRWRENPYW